MRIILTHEQADFDAIGALLAAHILDENAVPVLPRRVNRNVRAFLNLYGVELGLQEARDLPQRSIQAITLVDTQSLVTLKGMNARTTVHVVDHHQLRSDLPAEWTIVHERLGACTTLLVENIRDRAEPLNMLQATTLLLGIYEDTGSLTYISTTPRDVQAVAFLLEQGASLRIASEYLNPPLSDEQRKVYNNLLQSAESHAIHGQNIIIATTQAEQLNEEISSIAHKLRDLLDPDALFLLVQTNEGVRLVARSTTDRVNVAEIANIFGGGGHDRAAAALIREADVVDGELMTLTGAYHKLLSALPALVKPAITVGTIMSRGPRVLPPETSAQDAARLMQRYGYEGYPVVKDGQVIGLLTRRAVDRAISHRLNLPAASLMDAGNYSVHPQHTIDHLQRLMADTGWGQIPVIAPANGEIIGIVTRTDLLKILGAAESQQIEPKNLAIRLENALPPTRLAFLKKIAEKAHELHLPVFIVGGFVRDLILERPSLDFDVVAEGDAIALARALEQQFGGRVITHSRFGTAKWQIGAVKHKMAGQLDGGRQSNPDDLPESLDFISARTEFYNYPTALPTVERGSIKLDLHRRDFTINTLAMRLDGRHYGDLYDYWGGLNDLQKGYVRVLHSLSFVDDPTRMLRAVRFEQRFQFNIEARTLELMREANDLLKQVSGDRLRHELDLILSEKEPTHALNRLENLALLKAIHPELQWNSHLDQPLKKVLTESLDPTWELPDLYGSMPTRKALCYLVWWMTLPQPIIESIASRLRLSHHLRSALLSCNALWLELDSLPDNKPSRIVARLDEVPLVGLYAIQQMDISHEVSNVITLYGSSWRKIQPMTDGYMLHAMGVMPGPSYRQILWALRAAWLDGKVHSREQESALLQQILHQQIY